MATLRMLLLFFAAFCNHATGLRPSQDAVDLSGSDVLEPTWFQTQCALWAQVNVRDLGIVVWSEANIEQVSAWDQLLAHLKQIHDAASIGANKQKVKNLRDQIKVVRDVVKALNKEIAAAGIEAPADKDVSNLLVMVGKYFVSSIHEVPDDSSPSSEQVKLAVKMAGQLTAAIADCAASFYEAIPVITALGDSFPDISAPHVDPLAPQPKFSGQSFVQYLVNWMTWPTYYASNWNEYIQEVVPSPQVSQQFKNDGIQFDMGESDPIHSTHPYNKALDSLRLTHEYLTAQLATCNARAFP